MTIAGLHRTGEKQFLMVDLSYRVLPGDIRGEELAKQRVSCNCLLICWPDMKDRKENFRLLTT